MFARVHPLDQENFSGRKEFFEDKSLVIPKSLTQTLGRTDGETNVAAQRHGNRSEEAEV